MTPTPEQTAQWAREASATGDSTELSGDALLRFAVLACAWQAEQDAKLCEDMEQEGLLSPCKLAAAIRASVKGGA